MAINRGYDPNHKILDRMGRVTPNVEYSHSERPHFESYAAPWLPVQRYDYELDYYVVISAGKVVAEDRNGHLVPAGLRKAFNVASGATALSYTATDVAQGVIDLTTGVAVTAAVSYTETQLTQALKERGFIKASEHAMDFVSKPVGIASYNYWKAAGDDHFDPRALYQTNFRPQALTAITCDYAITLPVVPSVATTETMANDRTGGAAGLLEDYIDGTQARAAGWFTSTQIHELVKYSSDVAAGDDVVCYMFVNYPLADITDDTPYTASVAGLLHRKTAVTEIAAAGDYFIDRDMGLLFVYEAGGDAIPSPWTTAATITYYHYNSAATAAGNSYACATGDLNFGDLLTYDASSNLIRATLDIGTAEGYDASGNLYSTDPAFNAAASGTDDTAITIQIEQAIQNHQNGIVGQVIGVNEYPRDYLERVKTAFSGYSAANMRTPGSATGGRSDQLTYAGAAEKMIIVNLIFR
jgi:hypothetical protein